MDKLAIPWLFVGPSGSGKATQARRWIEAAHGVQLTYPLESRTFSIGDGYEARVLTSPYHFEIDIPNLSMQDKQIIGDLLAMFLSSGDVLSILRSASRKLVVLRRAHCLSLPAAIRVRAILQQYVLPANASGMVWMTAREVTGPLALLEDAFVRFRVPRMPYTVWSAPTSPVPEAYRSKEAWDKLEGHVERATIMSRFFPIPEAWPRRIQDYYDDMVVQMIHGARANRDPTLQVVDWLRKCVYEALSFCQTGPEIVDHCAAAMTRCNVPPATFWRAMQVLAESEPHTSYRTPLSLEWALLNMYEEMRKTMRVVSGDGEAADKAATQAEEPKTVTKGRKAPSGAGVA
jgi:hypothetical protein